MLDEPSARPRAARSSATSFASVAELRRTGVSILLVEQNARAALELADYGYVLENGATVLEGAGRDLQQDQRVIAAYLGIKAVAS